MWLLDTLTLNLKEFNNPPPYAILSHTWGPEEVSFQDIKKPASKALRGYEKIEKACALARSQRIEAIWIDTCCINKTSSAELSEAINSMYTWYRQASICYVYLNDFSIRPDLPEENGSSSKIQSSLENCRWFTRGWTLQEFLAPYNVEFYDRHWHYIGDKIDLTGQISSITGIGQQYIVERDLVSKASVAARMSWASRRSTTRPEDEAYCLIGLFEVNMPLLYGEGKKAFRRLQHEIARSSDDESLFAWYAGDSSAREVGMFADSPISFAYSQDIFPLPRHHTERQPYTITNRGLAMDVQCFTLPFQYANGGFSAVEEPDASEFILLHLNCARVNMPEKPFTIILRRVYRHTYIRFLLPTPSNQKYVKDEMYGTYLEQCTNSYYDNIYIMQPTSTWDSVDSGILGGATTSVWVYPDQPYGIEYALKEWYVSHLSCVKPSFYGWIVRLLDLPGTVILKFKRVEGDTFIVVLNFDVNFVNNRIIGALHVPTATDTFTEVVDNYKANLSLPHSIRVNREQSVRTSDGTLVELERDLRSPDIDSFWLRIKRP